METTTIPEGESRGPGFEAELVAAIANVPNGSRTRFAPAPTGYLHLGHVANAAVIWRVARACSGRVILRIEDHDRQRCRPEYETALLVDLDALGFRPDEPTPEAFRHAVRSSYRQSDNGDAYRAAVEALDAAARIYACDCSRARFRRWASERGHPWSGPGCPAGCAERRLPREAPSVTWRVRLGDGHEEWTDLALGSLSGPVAPGGDPAVRDQHGNWTYLLCVVVDDLRHQIDLVIRGEDLSDATPAQIRLGRLLGREAPPRFLHHPLVRQDDGRKLSKAAGATAIRSLLAEGVPAGTIRERAGAVIGLRSGA